MAESTLYGVPYYRTLTAVDDAAIRGVRTFSGYETIRVEGAEAVPLRDLLLEVGRLLIERINRPVLT